MQTTETTVDRRVVTAPFVAQRHHAGSPVLVRLDRAGTAARQAVPETALAALILRLAADPIGLDELRAQLTDHGTAAGVAEESVARLEAAGFLLDLDTLAEPLPSIELEVTNSCNATCIMCPRDELRSNGSMTEDVFGSVLDLVSSYACPGVIIQGIGEPSLHKRLPSWIAQLRMVLAPDAAVVVVTNGFKVTADYYATLISAGMTLLQWSFHSLKADVYNEIMGVDRFARAKANFEACAQVDPERLSINFVEMAMNRSEWGEVKDWATGLGVPAGNVGLIPVFSRGGTVDSIGLSGGVARGRAGRCLYIRRSLFIAWDGRVLPCSNDIRGDHAYLTLGVVEPEQVLRTWRTEVLSPPPAYSICASCDHFSRETRPTAWFGLQAAPRR